MISTIQLKNPYALLAPEVEKILRKATDAHVMVAPGGFDTIAGDLFRLVTQDNYFIILGFDGSYAQAVAWGFFPSDRMFPYPTVTMFYSEGSKELLRAMREKLLEVLLSRGYTTAWAVNITGKPDKAWARVFETPGKTKVSVLGSVMQLSLI